MKRHTPCAVYAQTFSSFRVLDRRDCALASGRALRWASRRSVRIRGVGCYEEVVADARRYCASASAPTGVDAARIEQSQWSRW